MLKQGIIKILVGRYFCPDVFVYVCSFLKALALTEYFLLKNFSYKIS